MTFNRTACCIWEFTVYILQFIAVNEKTWHFVIKWYYTDFLFHFRNYKCFHERNLIICTLEGAINSCNKVHDGLLQNKVGNFSSICTNMTNESIIFFAKQRKSYRINPKHKKSHASIFKCDSFLLNSVKESPIVHSQK